ncbi:MAG: response regulator [Gammaproteobacteria bacterium]|nr:response regulator [Gammaproteobacteria bacterium]
MRSTEFNDMHDEINLSYIGLTVLEVRVLKSIFTLAPQLNEKYLLITPDRLDEADVILVNADDPASVQKWNLLSQMNRVTTSLMLTDNENLTDGDFKIRRPIRVQKLIAALEEIVAQTRSSFENSDSDSDSTSLTRILIVDDSFPVRKYMEHKLNELVKFPIKISFATSGEEAIELTLRGDYDMIFLDVMMEGVDGYKTCKTIKSNADTYIVMLTSKKSPFDKVRGTMSGCDAYVTKPPSDERLVEEIRKFLLRRPSLNGNAAQASAR